MARTPELADASAQLNRAREEDAAARTELLHAREQAAALERAMERLARSANAGSGAASKKQVAALKRRSTRLAKRIESLEAKLAEAQAVHERALKLFSRFHDPETDVEQLPDDSPMTLFPLRIEARFKDKQLWVRVFPDDALVDTFQPELAEVELVNARLYWIDIWRARGVEAKRRAAWRALVKGHGAGRAKWITERYAPLNPDEEPGSGDGQVLVITPPKPVPAPDQPPIAEFWSTVWRTGGRDREAAYAQLESVLSADRAAEVAELLVPVNLGDVPGPDPVPDPIVAFLDLPDPEDQATTAMPWTRAARAWLLPERLVLLGFNGGVETLRKVGAQIPSELQIGPDPAAPEDEQLRADGEDLAVPDPLLWTTDFAEAVRVGMGFVAELDDAQASGGFDRLLVLGVRLSSDAEHGAAQLETLIRDHQRSRKGLSLLPQGTPTNNTDESSSGYTWWEDSDVSYHHFFELDPGDDPDDWPRRRDGGWLAGLLGIDREVLKSSVHYFGTDQAQARAMNTALWPATLGYFMEQMMEPVFSDSTVEQTRDFFNRFVLGCGTTPAIRIGRQPYGVLPATAWSRMNWFHSREYAAAARGGRAPAPEYLAGLRELIERAGAAWTKLAAGVAAVGREGDDPQQDLLDVVGLHPASVEFYQRYAESFEQLYNRLQFSHFGLSMEAHRVAREYAERGLETLADFGWKRNGGPPPELLHKFFLRRPNLLHGVLVDAELSESSPLSVDRADGDNYLEWLQRAARKSHDVLRRQEGFAHGPPTALLYLMIRHALDLGFVEASLSLRRDAGLLRDLRAARKEPKFIHVADRRADTASRWEGLYRAEPSITGHPNLRLGEFIASILDGSGLQLGAQVEALDRLKRAPTAALERAFVEHLDCCSYRLDAWRSALVGCQLGFMRGDTEGALTRRGTLIGAYGWLEDLRPRGEAVTPAMLDKELAEVFQRADDPPLLEDPANFGRLHAPSPDHAVAAAILRNGYLARAAAANPETLSIDLSSERVRLALKTIDGIRNGQSLGALLGYQLERSLHDSEDLFLDRLIMALRQAFPLTANRLTETADDDADIKLVEASNVLDGLAFAEHLDGPGGDTYPYGLAGLPSLDELTDTTTLSAAEIGEIVDAKVARMHSVNDAVADLAMAEGVYQLVRGNYDRAAGTLDAFSKGNFPPIPEVAATPRTGRTLTHRIALHLEGGLDPADPAHATPRATGEPALNKWLAERLPPMTDVYAAVEYVDVTGASQRLTPSMAELGLEPVDLLYMLDAGGEREMPGFDDLLIHHAATQVASPPRADAVFELLYRPDPAPGLTLFEVAPLIRSLRGMVLGTRELRPTDLLLAGEAEPGADAVLVARPEKAEAVRSELDAAATAVRALATELDGAVGAAVDRASAQSAAIANLDRWATDYIAAVHDLTPFGLRAASLTTPHERSRPVFTQLQETIAALVARWEDKLDAFDEAIGVHDALPPGTPDEERFAALIRAGRIVSTAVVAPLPLTPDDMRATVLSLRDDLEAALGDLRLLLGARRLGELFAALQGFAPRVGNHDQVPVELGDFPPAILSIAEDLGLQSAQAVADVDARLAKAADALAGGSPEAALKALLGEAFVTLPEFALGGPTLAEWDNAWAARGELLTHLTTGPDAVPFPVDDWLHGLGRVREKPRYLEAATMLGEALGAPQPLDLEPLQFPFRPGDAWLGLRFASSIDSERLLYTAHFAQNAEIDPTDPGRRYCGVLVDEWSEHVPADEELTGLAFHFDRPSSEAPQAILLATPPEFTGAWRWKDLVDTLNETLDFARVRAVEPAQLDRTELARFLPTPISAVTLLPITAMLNLAQNNKLARQLSGTPT